jgi:4-hydroxythreonine-4-phosphate dehydrogenase
MKPLALTVGDPAGIGPVISIAARKALRGEVPFFLIGDPAHLPHGTEFVEIARPAECLAVAPQILPVLPHLFPGPVSPGKPDPEHAEAVIAVIRRAVALVQAGEAGGLVTNPIAKSVLKAGAGFAYPGHTEFLAALSGDGVLAVMMIASPMLKVVPLTIHEPLAAVPALLTPDLLERVLRVMDQALRRDFGIGSPRIAVAGLNPHAGESGMMGDEEIRVITPVLEHLRAEGITVSGPLSADTMFHPAARARYDAALAMYHDQALIPAKTLAFDDGVNVTLGLPFVRTSPDHGTAFDIAGKGLANPSSLIAALRMAAELATRRHAD